MPLSFFDRTIGNLKRAWSGNGDDNIADIKPDLPAVDLLRLRRQIDSCLEQKGGEVSARRRAGELGRAYLALNEIGRARFLHLLASDYGCDQGAVDQAVLDLQGADAGDARDQAERALRTALVPRRSDLLRQFNALPQGIKFLVDMRAELLALARGDKIYRSLAEDLRQLLVGWFDVGFLDLQRITWDAPAALLEKLIEYEAVHQIRSWDDLKNRLASDRRCFAFFHPNMPDEPLIFVEVALVRGVSDNIHGLLDETAAALNPADADTAIFYSISNAQAGLAGVSFGNFLIKRVVADLAAELPNLKNFATLSPVPGFRQWLTEKLEDSEASGNLLSPDEAARLIDLSGIAEAPVALRSLLARSDWYGQSEIAESLRAPLSRLCAQYLTKEKRGQRARDPVAHFHLTNGARLEQLNWLANRSPEGLEQSAGIMVNYLYKLPDIERNHEVYSGSGRVICAGAIKKLAKAPN